VQAETNPRRAADRRPDLAVAGGFQDNARHARPEAMNLSEVKMAKEPIVLQLGQCAVRLQLVADNTRLLQQIHHGALTKEQVGELIAALQKAQQAMP
jgi:hypothetical protein